MPENTTSSQLVCSSPHIVLASTQQHWGGGEVYLLALGRELRRRGVQVEFVARRNGLLCEHVRDDGFSLETVQGKGRNPLEVWRLRRWLSRQRRTVLLCNDSRAVTTFGLAAFGLKAVRTVAMRHTMFPIRSVAKYQRLAERVICVSHAVADACRMRGLSAESLRVVHSGIEVPQVSPGEVELIRQQLLPTQRHKLIVAVGNLHACKGHTTLIEAALQLKAMGVEAYTVIAGEGSELDTLASQIKTLGLERDVQLLGFRNDANLLLAAADVVAHPALNEGLCLTVAASMMLARPIVATAAGGLSDVLGIDTRMHAGGPYAAIIEPGDATDLANKIRQQLADPPSDAALAEAREYALERFSTPHMVNETLAVYHELWAARVSAA